MWQVTCKVGASQSGKLVTDSWFKAAWQCFVWRLKGRDTTMARYESDLHWARRATDFVDRRTPDEDASGDP